MGLGTELDTFLAETEPAAAPKKSRLGRVLLFVFLGVALAGSLVIAVAGVVAYTASTRSGEPDTTSSPDADGALRRQSLSDVRITGSRVAISQVSREVCPFVCSTLNASRAWSHEDEHSYSGSGPNPGSCHCVGYGTEGVLSVTESQGWASGLLIGVRAKRAVLRLAAVRFNGRSHLIRRATETAYCAKLCDVWSFDGQLQQCFCFDNVDPFDPVQPAQTWSSGARY